jgi:3-hydroxyisobutyrate dehydrogenase-like beta-hydroxyacid dehydrogenase
VSRLGWIGMGDMGTPMALRLLDAGHELVVWGRTARRLEPALDRGARRASSPGELAGQVEAVFLCVTDDAAVESVVFGEGGVASGLPSGALLVDHSTIAPARSRTFAERLSRERRAGWLDAPVSGGAAGARAGTLAVLIGGEASDVARATPWLAAYGKNLTHLGAAGAGQAAKSCSQAIFGTTIAAWVEVLAYARAVGLDEKQLVAALEGSWSDSPVRRHIVPHLARAQAALGNNLLQKDLAIVAETAEAHGVALPLAALAAASLKGAR